MGEGGQTHCTCEENAAGEAKCGQPSIPQGSGSKEAGALRGPTLEYLECEQVASV